MDIRSPVAIFISYNGALEPLLESQGIPYLKGLAKNGIKLLLLTFENNLSFKKKDEINRLNAELTKNQIKWYRLVYHKNPPVISTIYDILLGSAYCAYLILKNKVNIIHARSYVPAVIAFILNKIFKIKFIFDMRGMMIDEYTDANIFKKGGIIYRLAKIQEKKLLLSAKRIVVLTQKIKNVIKKFNYLQNKTDLKIEVIPCCVDLQKFSYDIQKKELCQRLNLIDKFIFLYIGSVGTWYFLEGMLDLFVTAKIKIPSAHFLFLSRGNKDFIRNAILNKKLDLNDFTITETPHDNISEYISECDTGIIFYKQTFSRLACCPIKFGEYLACGIPVILNSGIGDTEEIVISNRIGVVVKELNKKSYENAIDQFLEIKKEGILLRKRCREVAERMLSLDYGIEKYSDLYKDLK